LYECQRVEVSPTTLRTYKSQVERNIRPELGEIPVDELTAEHLDNFYGWLKERGLAPKTIRNHHVTIKQALRQAVRWELIRSNVAELARPPKTRVRSVDAPSLEDVEKLLKVSKQINPKMGTLLFLAAYTGMRRGELCALRWSDIDVKARRINVRHAVICVPGGLKEKSTKSERGRRIALGAGAIAALASHSRRVKRSANIGGVQINPDAFVFSSAIDGSIPVRPDMVTTFFIRVREEAGVSKVRLHDLRHFMATQLVGAGVDIRTVAERLGHLHPGFTLQLYTHALPAKDRDAADIMDRLLRR